MEGPPKDDVKDAPKEPPREPPRDEAKDPPRDDRPPREEEYKDTDRYRHDRDSESWGRDDGYRRDKYDRPPQRRAEPMDLGEIFTFDMISKMVVAGIVLFFIGAIIASASVNTDFGASTSKREDAMNMFKAGIIIMEIGMLSAATALLAGGLLNKEFDQGIREKMIWVSAILMIGTILLVLFGPMSIIGVFF